MRINAKAFFHVFHGLAGTDQFILVGRKPLKPHRTAGMKLACGDPDFRTQAVNKAVRKAGGNIPVNAGTVHLLHKNRRVLLIGCDNTVRMMRTKTVDMIDRLVKGWNDPDVAIWLDVENGCWIIRQSQTVQRKIRAWTSALLEKEKAKEKKKSNDVEPSKNESTLGTSSQPSE